MLSMKNMRHGGPGVKKLRPLFMGPFEVDHMVGASAVKLHLPPEWCRIHNVFHVSLTKPFLSDPAKPHRAVTPPPPVQWLDGEPLYRDECLLEHMVAKGGYKKFYKKFLDTRRNTTTQHMGANLSGTCLVVTIWSGRPF